MRTNIHQTLLCAASLTLASVVAVSAAPEVKSPKQVQQALGTLNRVVDHTGRLIARKRYSFLANENDEFKEGASALEQMLANEPADLRSGVEPMLKKASQDAQNIADASSSRDRAKLMADHTALANSVKQIIAAFPSNVQPGRPNRAREREEEKVRAQAK
jgi:beta-phosphoglucomutase-like phosphatase (HAD superfamily)